MPSVLLVDDNDAVREVLRLYAERFGLTVVGEARDGREGIELATRLRPDAIVLDERMPEMSGLAVLARLRRRVPASGIVFYSSSAENSRDAALALGARAYFRKPESPRTVMQTVAELLDVPTAPLTRH